MLVSALGLAMIASAVVIAPGKAAAFKLKQIKGTYAIGFHGDGGLYEGTGILNANGAGAVTGTLKFFGDDPICKDNVSGPIVLNADGVTGTMTLTLAFVSSANAFTATQCGDTDILTLSFALDRNARTMEIAEQDDFTLGPPETFAEQFEPVIGVVQKAGKNQKFKGTYGLQFSGDFEFYLATGALSVDKTGAAVGILDFFADGDLCVDALSGVVASNSDGVTGTLPLTLTFISSPDASSAGSCGSGDLLTLGFAADNAGKEIQFSELDDFTLGPPETFAEQFDPVYGVAHRTSGL